MNRQELYDYKSNKEWLEDRKEEIEKEYESIQKLVATYGNSFGGTSGIQDRLAESLVKLLDLKKETLDFATNLEIKLQEIDNSLLKIEQPFRNILTFVYIDGMNLVEVANKMNYSYVHMCRQHGEALVRYDKL